jgi:hypothetical protein
LAALGLGPAPLASAYDRDLGACPDLRPLRTVAPPSRAAARCARAAGQAGTAYVTAALAAHHTCLERWQDGEIQGEPSSLCVGSTVLATGERLAPLDPATAEALATAHARVRRRIEKRCAGATDLVPYGCDAADLSACVLADHAEHVGHLLASTHGDLARIENDEGRRCQRAIAKATRGFMRTVLVAHFYCFRPNAVRPLSILSAG